MRNVQWMSAGFCAALLFSTGPSFASGASPQTTQTSAVASTDRAFLTRALGVNQTEIVLGQMAVKRGATPEVRAMGEKMVQRHTDLARQLRELAQIDPGSAPPTLSADQQKAIARLAATSGYEFDTAFENTVSASHVEELTMYRQEVSHAADPRLEALAKGRVTALGQQMASASVPPYGPPANYSLSEANGFGSRRGW